MKKLPLFALGVFFFAVSALRLSAQGNTNDAVVLEIENRVEVLRFGAANWTPAVTNQVLRANDRFRTGFKSRAVLRVSNQGILRVGPLTTLEIQPPTESAKPQSVLDLKSGAAYFFHRDEPVETQFRTPQASGAIRGTEFNLEVDEEGRTVLTLIDGAVDLFNDRGRISLGSGEQGIVDPGQPPRKTAVIDAINIIQWALYYPGVLDLADISLPEETQTALHDSLAAYRSGDLLGAVAAYPEDRRPGSGAETIYLAAIQLAVGQVAESTALLETLGTDNSQHARLAAALRKVVAAVQFQTVSEAGTPETATEWLAESYYRQSRSELVEARIAARTAVEKSGQFGFGWVRLADMEFSFGNTREALEALEKGLALTPRNAQAHALKGFLLAAQNRVLPARESFEHAIALDGALANAWLGRGLTRIRRGEAVAGREDLQIAATLDPQRGVLRSYLGKAYSNEGDLRRADKELALAKRYDPNDPTAWLYSALVAQQQNRVNDAVRDLETSRSLNDNRSVFRSRLLLDQDRAVRSANLASIYDDAGMTALSVREASRAVNSDYANFSAHLFLANSYDALRDPRQVTLRYETPWLSELLLANLLAPVGAGTLSQNISQQEYSKLFQQDGLGISSSTEYFSRGEWRESASQYGTFGNTSYAIDANYLSGNMERPNSDFESLTLSLKIKQQLTPQDSILFQALYYDFEGGDLTQQYNQASADLNLRIKENQEPILMLGYNHEWSPGVNTLFLAARLQDSFTRTDPDNPIALVRRQANGQISSARIDFRDLQYQSDLDGFSTELQQIWQRPAHRLVAGGRYQRVWNETTSQSRTPTIPSQIDVETDMERASVYGYYYWDIIDSLRLTMGLTYDHLEYPQNIDIVPINDTQTEKDRLSPKAGLIWSPAKDLYVRGYYAKSLGGLYFDNSFRLEPVQIAGFTQAYRSLIPESVQGIVAGSEFDTWGAAVDYQFRTRTYVSLQGEILTSKADRGFGIFEEVFLRPLAISVTPEHLDYEEKSLVLTVNQLIGRDWSIGLANRVSQANLITVMPEIPEASKFADGDVTGVLNQLNLYAIYAHPCGFFGQVQSIWMTQSNSGYTPDLAGDNFWQFDAYVGYRFLRRQAELRLGLLNIFDQNYQLNPLNLYAELPRERTFAARFRFNF